MMIHTLFPDVRPEGLPRSGLGFLWREEPGHTPGAWLTHPWSRVLVNVFCLQILEFDEL